MSRSENRGLGLLLGPLAMFSLGLFLIPAFVIRPFRHQSESALGLAIAVKRIAPVLTVAALVGALVLSVASAVMVRQNYFEWMFHPIAAAGFVSAGDARLSDKEMVMAVQIGREARAYPIVQMGYHHILNDTVAEVPIVVTY